MDRFWENFPTIATALTGIFTVVFGTRWVAKNQGKTEVKKVSMEGDSKAEELYVSHIEKTLDRYEKEVERIRKELNEKLTEQKDNFNKQIEDLKKEFEREREKERTFYEAEIEKREDRIDELEVVLIEKESIIIKLKKGEI